MRKRAIIAALLLAGVAAAQDDNDLVLLKRIKKAGIAQGGGGACTATVTVENVGTQANSAGTNLSVSGVGGPSTTDANTLLVAYILFDGAGASVSGCTWNGVALTSAGTAAHNSTSNGNASLWYLLNPATSAQTLACTGTSVTEYYYGVMSFHNVNASTPIRASSYQTQTGSGTTTITGATSNSQDIYVTDIEATGGAGAPANLTSATSGAGGQASGQGYVTTSAASVSPSWPATGNTAMAGASVQCK